jgi:hypothetical protein
MAKPIQWLALPVSKNLLPLIQLFKIAFVEISIPHLPIESAKDKQMRAIDNKGMISTFGGYLP